MITIPPITSEVIGGIDNNKDFPKLIFLRKIFDNNNIIINRILILLNL